MFKYLIIAALLALAAADPKAEPKPGFLAAPLVAPLAAAPLAYTSGAYINPYTAYTAPLEYQNYYKYNYGYPYAYNYYY